MGSEDPIEVAASHPNPIAPGPILCDAASKADPDFVRRDIIVIGASAGGVEALPKLLGSLPQRIGASFFVTLHITPCGQSLLPQIIERSGALPAEHPKDRTRIQPNRIYVAPPDYHLLLEAGMVRLGHGPKENRHRPAIDPLFRSAAMSFGNRVAGVLLTGNLDDGVAGLKDIQGHGGLAIIQDPAEAAYPEMPRSALAALQPDHCLKIEDIEALLKTLSDGEQNMKKGNSQPGTKPPQPASNPGQQPIAESPQKGPPIPLVCPECQGPIWEIHQGKLVRYQCLVGHRYTLENLLAAHSEELERALWVALRTLEERVKLQRSLAEKARVDKRASGRQFFLNRARENEKHAQLLREILEKLGD